MKSMNRTILTILTVGLMALFVLCTRQPTEVAGGSTSTSNARLTGTVLHENGQVAVGVTVILRNLLVTSQGDIAKSEWHTLAGTSGDYAFNSIPKGDYVLVASDPELGEAACKTKCEVKSDTAVQLTLSNLYALKGRVIADSSTPVQNIVVAVAGLTRPVHPDDRGFYEVPGVPPGQYDIGFIAGPVVDYLPVQVLSRGSCTSDTVYLRDVYFTNYNSTPYGYYGTTLSSEYSIEPIVYAPGSEPSWYSGKDFSYILYFATSGTALHEISDNGAPALLLDDFDDGDDISMIDAITGKAFWYVYSDTIAGGNSMVLPAGVSHEFSLGITDSAAFSGKSVQTTVILRHAIKSPYAGIGIDVEAKSAASVDLSAMQSFSFMLKGKGQIRVIFWSRLATTAYADTDYWGQFGMTVGCPQAWTKTVIRSQDLATPAGSKQLADSLKWQDAATNIFKIEFSTWHDSTQDTVQISLDQVYINGVTESVFR
jgi:hypothetical protein